MFRYSTMSFLAFSITAVVANIVVPKPANPINPTNPFNPTYPVNNTYPTFYVDYTDYADYDDLDKIFKYKNNKMSVSDNIRNSLRSLYYPFERKIPLYAHLYSVRDTYTDIYKDNSSR